MKPRSVADVLLEHAPDGARDALSAAAEIGPLVERTVAAGRAAWPGVDVDAVDLAAYLGARLPEAGAVEALRAMQGVDLYLACACAAGQPVALAALDARLVAVANVLPRRGDAAFAGETLQRVREKLLVASGDRPPKIAEYTGRSALDAWLRVVATRVAIDLLRARDHAAGADGDALERVPSPARDPEIEHLRARYRGEFRAALAEAAALLTVRERNVLRQHYVDGLSLEALADHYGVHRVTLARRIRGAREKLTGQTRRVLLARFGLGRRDLDSIMAVFRTELDLSIRSALSPSE